MGKCKKLSHLVAEVFFLSLIQKGSERKYWNRYHDTLLKGTHWHKHFILAYKIHVVYQVPKTLNREKFRRIF